MAEKTDSPIIQFGWGLFFTLLPVMLTFHHQKNKIHDSKFMCVLPFYPYSFSTSSGFFCKIYTIPHHLNRYPNSFGRACRIANITKLGKCAQTNSRKVGAFIMRCFTTTTATRNDNNEKCCLYTKSIEYRTQNIDLLDKPFVFSFERISYSTFVFFLSGSSLFSFFSFFSPCLLQNIFRSIPSHFQIDR